MDESELASFLESIKGLGNLPAQAKLKLAKAVLAKYDADNSNDLDFSEIAAAQGKIGQFIAWWSSSWLVLSFVLNNIMWLGSIVFAIITTAVSYQRKYAKDAKDAKVDAAKKTRGGVDDAAKGGATKVADGGAGTKVQDKADATKMKTAKVEAAAATKTKTEKEAPRKTKRVNECVVCGCDGHAHMHNCAECGSQFCRLEGRLSIWHRRHGPGS